MTDAEQPTCGKGLAENSILPATLSKLLTAMAENLEVHTKALDLTDENSRAEYDAYEELIKQLRQISSQLEATANQMAGFRNLSMGRHDEQVMTHPIIHATFQNFVKQKQELLSLLEQTAERDNRLLEMMREHAGNSSKA